MATIKITAYGYPTYYRCDLSQAAAPISYWSDGDWVSTQYQCADARHRLDIMAELAFRLEAQASEVSLDQYRSEAEWEELDEYESGGLGVG